VQGFDAFFQAHQFAVGRIDAGNVNKVLFFDAGLAKSQLEGLQLVLVDAHAFGEEGAGGNHGIVGHVWTLLSLG